MNTQPNQKNQDLCRAFALALALAVLFSGASMAQAAASLSVTPDTTPVDGCIGTTFNLSATISGVVDSEGNPAACSVTISGPNFSQTANSTTPGTATVNYSLTYCGDPDTITISYSGSGGTTTTPLTATRNIRFNGIASVTKSPAGPVCAPVDVTYTAVITPNAAYEGCSIGWSGNGPGVTPSGRTATGHYTAGNYYNATACIGTSEGCRSCKTSGNVCVVKVTFDAPSPADLKQGDCMSMSATIAPSDRTIAWSVSGSAVSITSAGKVYFQSYGTSWLPNSTATVSAFDSVLTDCKVQHDINIIGFIRAGTLTEIGPTGFPNDWLTSATAGPGTQTVTGSAANRTLGVNYVHSSSDKCDGRIIRRKFKYAYHKLLDAHMHVTVGDFGDNNAEAGAYLAKNGVQVFAEAVAVSDGSATMTIGVGPVSIGVPNPGSNAKHSEVVVPDEHSDETELTNAEGEDRDIQVPFVGYTSARTSDGYFSGSTSDATAWIDLWVYDGDDQYGPLDAFTFVPKIPCTP